LGHPFVGNWIEKYHRPPEFLEGEAYRLDVVCYFKGEVHGDPENCRKAVQDALFSNDKHIWGLVSFAHTKDCPFVEITVKKEVPPQLWGERTTPG